MSKVIFKGISKLSKISKCNLIKMIFIFHLQSCQDHDAYMMLLVHPLDQYFDTHFKLLLNLSNCVKEAKTFIKPLQTRSLSSISAHLSVLAPFYPVSGGHIL